MEIRPQEPAGRLLVQRYGGGGFLVGGQRIVGSILVFPTRAIPWPIAPLAPIDEASLAEVITARDTVELLLIGCGRAMGSIGSDVRGALRTHGIAVDVMDTGAACRTYNVLVGEDRRVAAALVAVA